MEQLIAVEEMSRLLGLKPFTVRTKCRQRKIPCYKIDGVYKFKMSEVEKWLESKKQKVVDKIDIELVRQVKIR